MPTHRTPTVWLTDRLRAAGSGSYRTGQYQCPSHADSSPSLSVGTGRAGQALIHCQAGCDAGDVLGALGLGWADLRAAPAVDPAAHAAEHPLDRAFPTLDPSGSSHPAVRGLRLESVHDYDRWLLERWRDPNSSAKEMAWFTKQEAGGNIPGLMGTPTADLPLYREREVRMAVAADEPVVVCESESSVDALNHAGLYATTWAGGASVPNVDRLVDVLAGGQVVLVPDNDPAGLAAGRSIWRGLAPVTDLSHVMPDEGQDARDLLAQRGTAVFSRDPPAGQPDAEEYDHTAWDAEAAVDDDATADAL